MRENNDLLDIVDNTIRGHRANINLARANYDTDEIIMEQTLVIELLELKIKTLLSMYAKES